jgi:hypothetical protein
LERRANATAQAGLEEEYDVHKNREHSRAEHVDATPKVTYAELTVGELVSEDANHWPDRCPLASR